METHTHLDRLTRGTAVGIAGFGLMFGWVVANRLDSQTIGILGGVFIGVLVCVPVLIAAMLMVRNAALNATAMRPPEVIEQPPAWAPALPPARKSISVPLVMNRGVPAAQVVLTTQTRAQNGQSVELGADLDTLRALAPIVGVRPPTRSVARELGIMGNDELSSTLDWLALHGWCTQGVQGKPRAWTDGATAEGFGQWLEQFA